MVQSSPRAEAIIANRKKRGAKQLARDHLAIEIALGLRDLLSASPDAKCRDRATALQGALMRAWGSGLTNEESSL